MIRTLLFATTASLLVAGVAAAQAPAGSPAQPAIEAATGEAGDQDRGVRPYRHKPAATSAPGGERPLADQALGKRFVVTADTLPEPYAEPAVRNPPLIVERGDRQPQAPDGFKVQLFAQGLAHPRNLLVLDNGDVLVAQQKTGDVMLLRDKDQDGSAEFIELFAQGFNEPYGLAKGDGEDILVADVEAIWVVPHVKGDVRASGDRIYGADKLATVPEGERHPQMPMDHMPLTQTGLFGVNAGHTTRSLARHPKTGRLYVGVGSAGNIGIEPPVKATIQRFKRDGSGQQTFASGMRNPVGLEFHPETGALWATVQERDGLGNRLVPDYFTEVKEGGFYGWPYAYLGGRPQPQFADRAPEKVASTLMPDLLFEAHSSAMNFAFYTGEQFPEEYRGDAFVALKGSWNRADPTGYKVVRVPFENGRPTGGYENFINNFWVAGEDRAQVWGRPVDVAVMPDGSLLVADDTGGTIWKVSFAGRTAPQVTGATGSTPAPQAK